jgi:hypothetical protein
LLALWNAGKWEKRKGYDVLLEAFWNEFSADEDVVLYIRASLDSKNTNEFEKMKEEHMNKTGKKKRKEKNGTVETEVENNNNRQDRVEFGGVFEGKTALFENAFHVSFS